MHGPSPAVIGLAVALVVSLAAVVWFVALRGSGPTSAFLTAHDRFAAAAQTYQVATGDIQRALELDEFKVVVDEQLVALKHQRGVFERIATEEDGTAQGIADLSVAQADRVITAVDVGAAGIIRRRLSDLAVATTELQAGLAALDVLAAEWKKLQ